MTGVAVRPDVRVRPVAVVAAVIGLLVAALFAHGCHTGDHDDEPAFVPLRRADR